MKEDCCNLYYEDKGFFLYVILLIPFTILILLICNLAPQNVYSNANPTSYPPQSNSVIEGNGTLPENVVITYSERMELKVSYIHVTNSDNERVDKNDHVVSSDNPQESSV